jgi:hypothetical protein
VKSNQLILLPIFIVVTAFSNMFLSNIPNFSPIASVALFSGFYFSNKKIALLIPVACMLISDYFLGFHNLMWAVYLSFSLIVVMGFYMKSSKPTSILFNSITSAVLFFLVTNCAVWAVGSYYTKDLSGLMLCLTMGLPFFKYTLLSSVIFSTILFAGFELFTQLSNKFSTVSGKSQN